MNPTTRATEYFRLYKDSEVGFDGKLQKTIKEAVFSSFYTLYKNFDDDCQTDDDQIDSAQTELELWIKSAHKELGKNGSKAGEVVHNSRFNSTFRSKLQSALAITKKK